MASPLAPTCLVVVPHDTHHYLGAMVLTGKLRRLGLSVRLLLDATPAMVKARMQQYRFDTVFLSASCGESLERIRRIVESAKAVSGHHPSVVVGGAIRSEVPEVAQLTGADHATDDPIEALALCNLTERCANMSKTPQGLG
jgi:methylmalonyl-CoA mutase cobalamin-binding subunit